MPNARQYMVHFTGAAALIWTVAACKPAASSSQEALATEASFADADAWFSALAADPAAVANESDKIGAQSLSSLQATVLAKVTDDPFQLGGYSIKGLKTKMFDDSADMQNFTSKYTSLQDLVEKEHLSIPSLTKYQLRSDVALLGKALRDGVNAVTSGAGLDLADAASTCEDLAAAATNLTKVLASLPPPKTTAAARQAINAQAGSVNVLASLVNNCITPEAAKAAVPSPDLQRELSPGTTEATPNQAGSGVRRK